MVNRFRGNSNHWKQNIQQYPIVLVKTPSYNINMHLIVPESITLTVIIIECSFSLNIKETGKKQFTFSFCFLFIEIVSMFWNLYLYYVTTHVCYHRAVLKKSNTNHYAYWTVSIASDKCLKLEIWQSITGYLLQQH